MQPFGNNTLTSQTGQDRQPSDNIRRTMLQTPKTDYQYQVT